MRGKVASGEEYIRLCEEHTASEIAEIMEVSKGFVSKLQAKHKVKPKESAASATSGLAQYATKRCALSAERQRNIQNTSH